MTSKKTDVLHFSEDGLSNRSLFLSEQNDVNIFVEDTGKEFIYEEIFERLFGNTLHIFSVFPLGGKDNVLRQQQARGVCDESGRINIFLVDGDFDILWDEKHDQGSNLIYLDRYNIESYYCTKNAVIKYMRTFLKKTREETEKTIDFDMWLQTFRSEFGALFVLFAIANRYETGLPNVGSCIGKFLGSDGRLRREPYQIYKKELEEYVESIDIAIETVRERIDCQFNRETEDKVLSIICGKCQIESLCRYLTSRCHRNINRDNIRNSLLMTFDLESLQFVKKQVLYLIAANK